MQILTYILLAVIAALASATITPVVIRYCRRRNKLDQPGTRKVHRRAVPRLGGVALFSAISLGMALIWLGGRFSWLGLQPELVRLLPLVFIGLAGFFLIGYADDLKSLPALPRLLAQFGVATGIVLLGSEQGLRIGGVLGYPLPDWLAVLVTVVWIVGVVNTFNWIDGLDGLASGIAGISALAFMVLAIASPGLPNSLLTAVLCAVLLGAIMGYLPFNFNPARIFIGDCGAFSLGYMLAMLSIVGMFKQAAAITFLLPILILALPIGDTTFAIVRRLATGRRVTEADDKHIHHRMLALISRTYRARLTSQERQDLDEQLILNRSHRGAVLVLYSFAAVFALVAVVLGVRA